MLITLTPVSSHKLYNIIESLSIDENGDEANLLIRSKVKQYTGYVVKFKLGSAELKVQLEYILGVTLNAINSNKISSPENLAEVINKLTATIKLSASKFNQIAKKWHRLRAPGFSIKTSLSPQQKSTQLLLSYKASQFGKRTKSMLKSKIIAIYNSIFNSDFSDGKASLGVAGRYEMAQKLIKTAQLVFGNNHKIQGVKLQDLKSVLARIHNKNLSEDQLITLKLLYTDMTNYSDYEKTELNLKVVMIELKLNSNSRQAKEYLTKEDNKEVVLKLLTKAKVLYDKSSSGLLFNEDPIDLIAKVHKLTTPPDEALVLAKVAVIATEASLTLAS